MTSRKQMLVLFSLRISSLEGEGVVGREREGKQIPSLSIPAMCTTDLAAKSWEREKRN
jgi:hypothetical protein